MVSFGTSGMLSVAELCQTPFRFKFRKPMPTLKLDAHHVRMVIGFSVMAAVTAMVSLPFSHTQAPASYGRGDMLDTELFSPWTGPARRHVIIGSCEISLPIVANDMDKPGVPPRNETSAWLGNILNFLMHNAYRGGGEDGFFDLSAPNTGLPHHAQFLWYATRVPGLSSIIYVNGLSLSTEAGPDDTLEVVAALERMEADLPQAAPAIRAYGDTLRQSKAFLEAERLHPDWRNALAPHTATLEASWADTLNKRETQVMGGSSLSARFQYFLAQAKAKLNLALGGSARLLRLSLVALGAEPARRDEGVRRELDWAKGMTGRADYDAQVKPQGKNLYLDGPEQELQRRWLEMLAAVAEARGVRLVIYGQPMLGLSPAVHAAWFRPHYMERAREWLAPWKPAFIDHTVDHDLAIRDFALSCPADKPDCTAAPFEVNGYNTNIVGRFRQGRLLIEALRQDGILAGLEPRTGGRARLDLPPAEPDRCIKYEGQEGSCIRW